MLKSTTTFMSLAGPCPASVVPLVSVSSRAVACFFPCLSYLPCLPLLAPCRPLCLVAARERRQTIGWAFFTSFRAGPRRQQPRSTWRLIQGKTVREFVRMKSSLACAAARSCPSFVRRGRASSQQHSKSTSLRGWRWQHREGSSPFFAPTSSSNNDAGKSRTPVLGAA